LGWVFGAKKVDRGVDRRPGGPPHKIVVPGIGWNAQEGLAWRLL